MVELFNVLAKGALSITAPTTQVFDDVAAAKITVFDNILVTRGGIIPSIPDSDIEVPKTGSFDVILAGSIEMGISDELNFGIYVNGVLESTEMAQIQGKGAGTPVPFNWSASDVGMSAGNTLDVRAMNAKPGNVSVDFRSLFLAVKADS